MCTRPPPLRTSLPPLSAHLEQRARDEAVAAAGAAAPCRRCRRGRRRGATCRGTLASPRLSSECRLRRCRQRGVHAADAVRRNGSSRCGRPSRWWGARSSPPPSRLGRTRRARRHQHHAVAVLLAQPVDWPETLSVQSALSAGRGAQARARGGGDALERRRRPSLRAPAGVVVGRTRRRRRRLQEEEELHVSPAAPAAVAARAVVAAWRTAPRSSSGRPPVGVELVHADGVAEHAGIACSTRRRVRSFISSAYRGDSPARRSGCRSAACGIVAAGSGGSGSSRQRCARRRPARTQRAR